MVVEFEWSELESSTMIRATVKAESQVQMHKCLEITAMSFHINWHIALNSVIHLTVRNKDCISVTQLTFSVTQLTSTTLQLTIIHQENKCIAVQRYIYI